MISTDVKDWGVTKDERQVFCYTLKNEFLEVSILNYGGIIQKIMMPDKNGKFENIVLGFDNIEGYEERSPHFGAIVGRTAGRIKKGELIIMDFISLKQTTVEIIFMDILNFMVKRWDCSLKEEGKKSKFLH